MAQTQGNFPNYATFNPPDARLSNVPSPFPLVADVAREHELAVFTMLDVGCNAGELTVAIAERVRSSSESTDHRMSFIRPVAA